VSGLLSAVPALVVVACAALFVVGVRLLRSDAVDGLEVGDLALLRLEQRRDVTGRGPLARLAQALVPLLRRGMGPALEERLKRMIELQRGLGTIKGEVDFSKIVDTQFLPDDLKALK